MSKNQNSPASIKEIERLLGQQVREIEQRIDKKVEDRLAQQTVIILSAVDEKLKKTEISINKKIDRLTATLDGFLKRLTVAEDEFEVMKLDINRMKKVLREKLGVDLS